MMLQEAAYSSMSEAPRPPEGWIESRSTAAGSEVGKDGKASSAAAAGEGADDRSGDWKPEALLEYIRSHPQVMEPPTGPAYWHERISAENDTLKASRLVYERMSNQMTLTVVPPSAITASAKGHMIRLRTEILDVSETAAALQAGRGAPRAMPYRRVGSDGAIEVTINLRRPLRDLMATVHGAFGSDSRAFGLPESERDWRLNLLGESELAENDTGEVSKGAIAEAAGGNGGTGGEGGGGGPRLGAGAGMALHPLSGVPDDTALVKLAKTMGMSEQEAQGICSGDRALATLLAQRRVIKLEHEALRMKGQGKSTTIVERDLEIARQTAARGPPLDESLAAIMGVALNLPMSDFAETLGHGTMLVAWDGIHLAGSIVVPGGEGEPVVLHGEYLWQDEEELEEAAAAGGSGWKGGARGGKSSKKGPSAAIHRTPMSLVVPSTATLPELRAMLALRAGLVEGEDSSETQAVPTAAAMAAGCDLVLSRVGYERGKKKLLVIADKSVGPSHALRPATIKEYQVFNAGMDLLLEKRVPAGRATGGIHAVPNPLADAELQRRAMQAEVVVLWEAGGFPPSGPMPEEEILGLDEVIAVQFDITKDADGVVVEASARLTLTVSRGNTVSDVKRSAARVLGADLSIIAGGGRCR